MIKSVLCMLLLFAVPAVATITKVQSNATWGSTGTTCTAALTNTSSQNLLVVWATWSPSSLTATVGDSAFPTNSFPSAVGPTIQMASNTAAQIFYAKNINPQIGTDNVKVTFSGTATTASCVAVEYSGADQNYPLDSVSAGYSTSLNPTNLLDSGAVAPANSNLLVFGGGNSDTATVSVGTGFSQVQTSTDLKSITEQMIVSGNNTLQRATSNIGPSPNTGNWLMQMAVFRDASWTVTGGWTPARVGQIVMRASFREAATMILAIE